MVELFIVIFDILTTITDVNPLYFIS